jgi:hypothetical protein
MSQSIPWEVDGITGSLLFQAPQTVTTDDTGAFAFLISMTLDVTTSGWTALNCINGQWGGFAFNGTFPITNLVTYTIPNTSVPQAETSLQINLLVCAYNWGGIF